MKKLIYIPLLVLLAVGISCKEDNPFEPQDFLKGVFIINEGNLQSADGSVSFLHSNGTMVRNAFGQANNGRLLGDVVQSMAMANDRVYIAVNNSGTLEVAEAKTLNWIFTKQGLSFPRYVITGTEKGYLSEWVSFADSSCVTEFDLETGATLRTVKTGFGTDQILIHDNYLFASNNWSNTVSVIDLNKFERVNDIVVGSAPGGLELDQEGHIWVICGGGYNEDWTPALDGKLVRINAQTLSVDFELEFGMNVSTKMDTDHERRTLYFFSGLTIYSVDLSVPAISFDPFVTLEKAISLYGIGVDPDGNIYVADSKAFQGNGTVTIFNKKGIMESEVDVGRGPSEFLFVE